MGNDLVEAVANQSGRSLLTGLKVLDVSNGVFNLVIRLRQQANGQNCSCEPERCRNASTNLHPDDKDREKAQRVDCVKDEVDDLKVQLPDEAMCCIRLENEFLDHLGKMLYDMECLNAYGEHKYQGEDRDQPSVLEIICSVWALRLAHTT